MKCKIRWIDLETGQPTPDDNEAVGMAHAHKSIWRYLEGRPDNHIVGYSEEIDQSFPICQAHLDRMQQNPDGTFSIYWKGHRVWSYTPFKKGKE